MEDEKKYVISTCENALYQVTKMINKKRDEYLAVIDKQVFNFRQNLIYFEKQMKRAYALGEVEQNPTKEQLFSKVRSMDSYSGLLSFIHGIKEDMNEKEALTSGLEEEKPLEEARKIQLKILSETIESIKDKFPTLKTDKNLEEELESVNKEFEKVFNKVFCLDNEVPDLTMGARSKCIFEENGFNEIEEQAFYCSNCDMNVCKACKECHKGHSLTDKGRIYFRCTCVLKFAKCKKATVCTYQHSRRSYYGQIAWSCKTCNMSSGTLVCNHCANICHKGHTLTNYYSGSCFCDCYDLFTFCALKKKGLPN